MRTKSREDAVQRRMEKEGEALRTTEGWSIVSSREREERGRKEGGDGQANALERNRSLVAKDLTFGVLSSAGAAGEFNAIRLPSHHGRLEILSQTSPHGRLKIESEICPSVASHGERS